MPYIKPEYKKILERDLFFLAKRIRDVAKLYGELPEGRLPVYRYVCGKLALQVMPEKCYAVLSATRAVFFDAADEWCRRMKVTINKSAFTNHTYPILNKRIAKLVKLVKKLATETKNYNRAYPGILNYCFTVLGLNIMDDRKDKRLARQIAGTLEYMGLEFYEAQMAPYEDEQIAKNGDVF